MRNYSKTSYSTLSRPLGSKENKWPTIPCSNSSNPCTLQKRHKPMANKSLTMTLKTTLYQKWSNKFLAICKKSMRKPCENSLSRRTSLNKFTPAQTRHIRKVRQVWKTAKNRSRRKILKSVGKVQKAKVKVLRKVKTPQSIKLIKFKLFFVIWLLFFRIIRQS